MPIPPTALAAAHCARTIATIARTRAAWPVIEQNAKSRAALDDIAALLDTAAHSLETEEPGQMNGITITNTMDWDAYSALDSADGIAAANPTVGFPPEFSQYIKAPVFGNDIDLPPSLLPGGLVLIAQEGDLFLRLSVIHNALRSGWTPEVTAAFLEAAFRLHWEHAHLAESSAVDAARP